MTVTSFPAFFDRIPRIATYDPLAELLGAASGGRIEYAYADAVRLAGHSCPTVAGAYLITLKGLRALFGEAPAERGAVALEFRGAAGEGTTGVVASVMGLITGAAGEGGFKGLGGRYHRNGLLRFGNPAIRGQVRMSTAARTIDVAFDHTQVSLPPEIRAHLGPALQSAHNEADRKAVAEMFQARVREILVERRDDPTLVTVTEVGPDDLRP